MLREKGENNTNSVLCRLSRNKCFPSICVPRLWWMGFIDIRRWRVCSSYGRDALTISIIGGGVGISHMRRDEGEMGEIVDME